MRTMNGTAERSSSPGLVAPDAHFAIESHAGSGASTTNGHWIGNGATAVGGTSKVILIASEPKT